MPQRTPRPGKRLFHLLFLTAALSLLSAVVRRDRSKVLSASRARTRKIRVGPRRIAVSLAFATLFFAGAALSAGAGNSVIGLIDSSEESALSADTTTTTTAEGEEDSVAQASAGAQARSIRWPLTASTC